MVTSPVDSGAAMHSMPAHAVRFALFPEAFPRRDAFRRVQLRALAATDCPTPATPPTNGVADPKPDVTAARDAPLPWRHHVHRPLACQPGSWGSPF